MIVSEQGAPNSYGMHIQAHLLSDFSSSSPCSELWLHAQTLWTGCGVDLHANSHFIEALSVPQALHTLTRTLNYAVHLVG